MNVLDSDDEKQLILLVIDDDENFIGEMHRFFGDIPYLKSYFATNPSEALSFFKESGKSAATLPERPNLIFLNLSRSLKNAGIAFLKNLRADPDFRSIPVVIFSDSASGSNISEAYQFNIAGYIVKPSEYAKLRQILKDIIQYWLTCVFPEARKKTDLSIIKNREWRSASGGAPLPITRHAGIAFESREDAVSRDRLNSSGVRASARKSRI